MCRRCRHVTPVAQGSCTLVQTVFVCAARDVAVLVPSAATSVVLPASAAACRHAQTVNTAHRVLLASGRPLAQQIPVLLVVTLQHARLHIASWGNQSAIASRRRQLDGKLDSAPPPWWQHWVLWKRRCRGMSVARSPQWPPSYRRTSRRPPALQRWQTAAPWPVGSCHAAPACPASCASCRSQWRLQGCAWELRGTTAAAAATNTVVIGGIATRCTTAAHRRQRCRRGSHPVPTAPAARSHRRPPPAVKEHPHRDCSP